MIFRLAFYLALAAIVTGCVIAARIVTRRPLKLFARNLLVALIGFEVAVAGLHLVALVQPMPSFWKWFFNLQLELNLGSIFSALQLMMIALAACLAVVFVPLTGRQRAYFVMLVAVFGFLSLDEFYSFHETLGGRVETNAWRLPYAFGAAGLGFVSLAAWWFGFRREVRLFGLLSIGFVIMGVAGIVVEEVVMLGFVEQDADTAWMYVFEELFEMIGATIVLAGVVSYLQEQASERRWHVSARVLLAGGVLWTSWLVFWLLFGAALQARFTATPLDVTYGNGELSLVGYSMTPAVVAPGGEVTLTLFWRANQPLTEDYHLSVHALSHPIVASVAQADELDAGPIPSGAWFPNIVMRRVVYVQLPDDLPTPASYWLMVRVWSGSWGSLVTDTNGLTIANAGNRSLLTPDSLIIDHVAALSGSSAPPANSRAYPFPAHGFTLTGALLPAGEVTAPTVPMTFWWSAEQDGDRALTQFIHLVSRDSGEVFAFDTQPFGGAFPTEDWAAGMQVADEQMLTLTPDMPAGRYDAYTGMYDATTMARMSVTDSDGQPVANNAILIGTLDYSPARP